MPSSDQDMPGSNKRQAAGASAAAEDDFKDSDDGEELQRQLDALKNDIMDETSRIIQTKFGAATSALKAYVDQSNKRLDVRHNALEAEVNQLKEKQSEADRRQVDMWKAVRAI